MSGIDDAMRQCCNRLVPSKGLLEGACHDFGYVNIYVHFGARCLESDRDFLRGHRSVRHVQLEKTQWWTALFLATTVLTSVTGFFFPRDQLLPSHVVGIISLVVLAVAILALYVYHLAGSWRRIYVVTAVLALYLNIFVGVVQAFLKVPFLNALAPTQTEPPFLITQLVVLALFVVLTVVAAIRFHGESKELGGTSLPRIAIHTGRINSAHK